MKVPESLDIAPNTWYRRQLSGGDFSLEANTRTVPHEGRFYVLQDGREVFSSSKFTEALSAYQELCEGHWEERLEAIKPDDRIQAAWGLLGLDPENRDAAEVIRSDGNQEACKRLETLRRRHFAQRRAAAFKRKAAK